MTARWLQVKKRIRRSYLKKHPSGGVDQFMLKDMYGSGRRNPKANDIDFLDCITSNRQTQRAWIDEQRRKQKREQLLKPRPGVPQDIWYKEQILSVYGRCVQLWFSANRFKIVEITTTNVRTSTIYPTREAALSDYRARVIIWDSKSETPK